MNINFKENAGDNVYILKKKNLDNYNNNKNKILYKSVQSVSIITYKRHAPYK